MSEQNRCLEWVPGASHLTNSELDEKLEEQVIRNDESEKLICGYLAEVRERRAYRDFGYDNVYDYASERLGFSHRKTRYLLSLGRKVRDLPKLREALKTGKIGWCKASRVASIATKEDEAMWLDSAVSLSVRELERRIKDGTDQLASTVRFWLTDDQRAVWENALEICRRVAGAELAPGQALEYMAGEFLATYGHLLRDEQAEPGDADATPTPAEAQPTLDGAEHVCPAEAEELPSPVATVPQDPIWHEVLERDAYACRYPGCSARSQLHVHHIEFRARFGTKTAAEMNHPSNLLVICAFHHRMLHASAIGVSGKAPYEIVWRTPKLMEAALARRRNQPARYVGELEVYSSPGTLRSAAAVTA